jgi:hypothetical protein
MHHLATLFDKELYMFRTDLLSILTSKSVRNKKLRVPYQIKLGGGESRWLLLWECITMNSPLNVKFLGIVILWHWFAVPVGGFLPSVRSDVIPAPLRFNDLCNVQLNLLL